jgi:hypothetical protein
MVRDDAAGIVRALAKMMEERAEVRKRESGRGKLTYKEVLEVGGGCRAYARRGGESGGGRGLEG